MRAGDLREQQAHALRQAPRLGEDGPDFSLGPQPAPQPGIPPLCALYQRSLAAGAEDLLVHAHLLVAHALYELLPRLQSIQIACSQFDKKKL